jgi:hypothetical protein
MKKKKLRTYLLITTSHGEYFASIVKAHDISSVVEEFEVENIHYDDIYSITLLGEINLGK